MPERISIPNLCLVVLVGASGSGKSSFAREHFKPTEVLSSDFCRGLVSDDENDQTVTRDAFEVLRFIAAKRLAAGKLVVVDATNVQREARKPLVALAREHDVLPVAVVLDLPEKLCHERNRSRPDRNFGPHVVRNQTRQLHRSLKGLKREGFRHVTVLSSAEEVEAATVERRRLWTDRRDETGPFDIIGDVHGCLDELVELLEKLGYEVRGNEGEFEVTPPAGRRAIFLGDLVDRGPKTPDVLRLVMGMVESGAALCVPGNHDAKLVRALRGKNVQLKYGLAETLEQLGGEPPEFAERVDSFLDRLVSHYVLDGGDLVVAHAGLKEKFQGRASGRVRDFALFGETTGETDEFGLPVRFDWASGYRGKANVVYGHTPVPEAEWVNRTINIDTGCAFGGSLTALRYPERELVSVPACRTYYEPAKPFLPDDRDAAPRPYEDLLDIQDVLGKRIIGTKLQRNVTIREENAAAALEVMGRYAADPRWLVYLPPTMSPSDTSKKEGLLEHPSEALAYYRREGVSRVVCQEKHMGSRAIAVVCRDGEAAARRFGATDGAGILYTRTGRRFFDDRAMEEAVLERLRGAFTSAGMWEEFGTDWFCLDCEIMPWSVKAGDLIRDQYAAVGTAARASLSETIRSLETAADRGLDVTGLAERQRGRRDAAERYVEAYGRYAWPVRSVGDVRLAPFHLLASEGRVHLDRDHGWHIETLGKLCRENDGILVKTPHLTADTNNPEDEEKAIRWWEELTGSARGGEGMVVKPFDFVAKGRRGIAQPGVKCRGREYLRIIYGPEYTAPENLNRLRERNLSAKRSLALREFALGVEALERFVEREPLYRVHECVFGVLALESEPVDPRL
ncbi:polynucleotide kinase-phosphatase [Rubrobacter tropicus]|uniref:Polynucleotide kinase-phosphatase n=1 Tax=Rubrobacter tropicus TaxID=2653851 RepID=A0A6G8QAN2_9ACTN|nr:polynucleotide kinase-phosphatase [Rubrobacter tropicus]QIN83519.1 polynucleotide kinase-phosphatase [Rubrobacter tropicus]